MARAPHVNAARDRGYLLLIWMVRLVAAWLLALPVLPSVQDAALSRFHLQTRSFLVWALQAPVPAMYNFHNRYRVEPQPWDVPALGQVVEGTLNHFPVRLLTFAESRPQLLPESARIQVQLESSYRGRVFRTRWRLQGRPDGSFDAIDEVLP